MLHKNCPVFLTVLLHCAAISLLLNICDMTTSISTFLKKKGQYKVSGMLWIDYEGSRCFGPGRMQLLEGIAASGSINKAAKAMGMSYKKAWTMITEMNEQFSQAMVITQSGGKDGGGSVLTPQATELMAFHRQLRKKFAAFLEKETAGLRQP